MRVAALIDFDRTTVQTHVVSFRFPEADWKSVSKAQLEPRPAPPTERMADTERAMLVALYEDLLKDQHPDPQARQLLGRVRWCYTLAVRGG